MLGHYRCCFDFCFNFIAGVHNRAAFLHSPLSSSPTTSVPSLHLLLVNNASQSVSPEHVHTVGPQVTAKTEGPMKLKENSNMVKMVNLLMGKPPWVKQKDDGWLHVMKTDAFYPCWYQNPIPHLPISRRVISKSSLGKKILVGLSPPLSFILLTFRIHWTWLFFGRPPPLVNTPVQWN